MQDRIRGEGLRAQLFLQETEIAQHEGQNRLVSGEGVRLGEGAQHEAPGAEIRLRTAEGTVLALVVKNQAHPAQGFLPEFIVSQERTDVQHGGEQQGRTDTSGQKAPVEGALFSGFRPKGGAAGQKARAQAQKMIPGASPGRNGTQGQRSQTSGGEGRTGKKGTGQHTKDLPSGTFHSGLDDLILRSREKMVKAAHLREGCLKRGTRGTFLPCGRKDAVVMLT